MSKKSIPGPNLPEAKSQARSFEALREAHQREMFEDYVELIADLIDSTGEARVTDLAERLGVTPATVNSALQRLVREGLVRKLPYRSIFLTDEGRDLAVSSRKRHQLVVAFLQAIGVDQDVAEIDAEGIEHHLSTETMAAFQRVVDNAT
ncbi:MAG: manganese-binding transcriptional regulator MntR [Pseudomonadota bacterium]